MSALPTIVRVKRKRGEPSVGHLYLKEQEQQSEDVSAAKRARLWQYQLQPTVVAEPVSAIEAPDTRQQQQPQPPISVQNERARAGVDEATPRQFRFVPTPSSKKRKAGEADIATFIEATKKPRSSGTGRTFGRGVSTTGDDAQKETPQKATLKRPGKGTLRGIGKSEEWKKAKGNVPRAQPSEAPRAQIGDNPPVGTLVETLHEFAQESLNQEAEREKPKVTIKPKAPALRYRDRHPEASPMVAADEDVEMSDGEEYVYDTYVRFQHPVVPTTLDEKDPANNEIGFIVITEEDNPIWETYFEDEESDDGVMTDDEDENAEGYYGADYPEDEVASDDEFDKNAYGYRHGGSDDEQWDSDTGAFSDEDGDNMRNPWKKYPWQKGHKSLGKEDSDDDDN